MSDEEIRVFLCPVCVARIRAGRYATLHRMGEAAACSHHLDARGSVATLWCPSCQQSVEVANPGSHDIVYRTHSADGSEPIPFLMLHAPR